MTVLLLVLALSGPVEGQTVPGWSAGIGACSVQVLTVDSEGRLLPARAASGSRTPAMVFRGRTARPSDEDPPLVFDVFNPSGDRYQILLGTAYGRGLVLNGRPENPAGAVQATLAVAGSSIALTSMYGRWRVVPRFQGHDKPCGPARTFTIRP
jgi:hypothetical protein